jgi:hypothetical protein
MGIGYLLDMDREAQREGETMKTEAEIWEASWTEYIKALVACDKTECGRHARGEAHFFWAALNRLERAEESLKAQGFTPEKREQA